MYRVSNGILEFFWPLSVDLPVVLLLRGKFWNTESPDVGFSTYARTNSVRISSNIYKDISLTGFWNLSEI